MLTLFLIVFIDLVGFGIMVPLLPFYALRFGASPDIMTFLFAVYSIGQFFASPVLGRLSDKFGRKIILVASLAGSILAYGALGLADSLFMVFAARLFAGLTAGNISAAQAYITDITTSENRAKGMGIIGAAFGLGFIFGPVIGGLFAGSDPLHADFATPAFISAGLSAVALLGVVFFLPESLSRERRAELKAQPRPGRYQAARAVWSLGPLKSLIFGFFLITIAMAILETIFSIWINGRFGWGPKRIGFVFAYIGLVMALIQGGLIGRLTKRFGEWSVLLTGLSVLILGFVLLPFSPTIPIVLVATSLITIGYGLCQPSINSLISKNSPVQKVGLVMGVSQSAASLSRILGPLLSGSFYAYLSPKAPFLLGALLTVPTWLGVRHFRLARQHEQKSDHEA